MKIGLLLGSFNPFTKAHYEIAKKVLEVGLCDKVLIVVAKQNPWKDKYSASFKMRCLMCNEAIKDLGNKCVVSDIEKNIKGIPYSYKTLSELRKEYSKDTFSLIVGDDVIEKIVEWKNFKNLVLPYVDFIKVRRDVSIDCNTFIESTINLCGDDKKMFEIGVASGTLSSTQVRDAIKDGKPFKHMVNENVFNIINKYKLYS